MKSKADLYVIERVKEKRLEKEWTQLDLSVEIGVSAGFIGQAESPKNRTKYSVTQLNALAKVLDCSPKDFFPTKPL